MLQLHEVPKALWRWLSAWAPKMYREVTGQRTGVERHWRDEARRERRMALEKALLDAEVNRAVKVLERM